MKQSVGRRPRANTFKVWLCLSRLEQTEADFQILNVVPRKSQSPAQETPKSAQDDAGHSHENADGSASLPDTAGIPTTTPAGTGPGTGAPLAGPPADFANSPSHASQQPPVSYLSSPEFMSLISHSSFSDSYPAIASPLFDHGVFSDPGNVANDIFVPGSAYEALHTALRNRQLWTARSDISSRGSSPDCGTLPGAGVGVGTAATETADTQRQTQLQAQARPGREFGLSPEREIILWQNYLNEICLWVSILLFPSRPGGGRVG